MPEITKGVGRKLIVFDVLLNLFLKPIVQLFTITISV